MTLNRFGRSPLGAFYRSELGARDRGDVKLYVATASNVGAAQVAAVYKLNPDTGATIWRKEFTGEGYKTIPQLGTTSGNTIIADGQGSVLVRVEDSSSNEIIVRLDANDGSVLNSWQTGSNPARTAGGVAVTPSGNVFTGGRLFTSGGTEIWSTTEHTLPVIDGNGYLYARPLSGGDEIVRLNPDDGTKLWGTSLAATSSISDFGPRSDGIWVTDRRVTLSDWIIYAVDSSGNLSEAIRESLSYTALPRNITNIAYLVNGDDSLVISFRLTQFVSGSPTELADMDMVRESNVKSPRRSPFSQRAGAVFTADLESLVGPDEWRISRFDPANHSPPSDLPPTWRVALETSGGSNVAVEPIDIAVTR